MAFKIYLTVNPNYKPKFDSRLIAFKHDDEIIEGFVNSINKYIDTIIDHKNETDELPHNVFLPLETKMKQQQSNETRFIFSLYLEDIIGAGKSHWLSHMTSSIQVLIPEPVDVWQNFFKLNVLDTFSNEKEEWPCLDLFYDTFSDKFDLSLATTIRFIFQFITIFSRTFILFRSFELNPNINFFISERSLESDKYVFADSLIPRLNTFQLRDLNNFYLICTNFLQRAFPLLKKSYLFFFDYVNTTDEQKKNEFINCCYYNIKMRNRPCEQKITKDYLNSLFELHFKMIKILQTQTSDVIIWDWNQSRDKKLK